MSLPAESRQPGVQLQTVSLKVQTGEEKTRLLQGHLQNSSELCVCIPREPRKRQFTILQCLCTGIILLIPVHMTDCIMPHASPVKADVLRYLEKQSDISQGVL